MIANIDENFGRLQTTLDESGIADDTILVFMTDNGTATGVELDGDQFPREGPGSYNAGMRGKKGSAYEGGHRVPFLIRYPDGHISGGRDIDTLTSYVDFMRPCSILCGVRSADGRTFHGRSLVPLLRGGDDSARADRVTVCDTQRVAHPVKWRKSAVMRGRWRLIDGRELYDLGRDPGQRRDTADRHPAVVAELRAAYDDWWDLVSEQLDRDEPIALGGDDQAVKLSTHDIRNEACGAVWNQRQVRAGQVTSGVLGRRCQRGEPLPGRAAALARGDRIFPDRGDRGRRQRLVPRRHPVRKTLRPTKAGSPLALGWARLSIGARNCQQEVDPAATGAIFEIDLAAGPDRLYASFHDHLERSIAPYYVYVQRLSGQGEHPPARGIPWRSQFLIDGDLFVEVVDNDDGGGFPQKRVDELSRANKEGRFDDVAFPLRAGERVQRCASALQPARPKGEHLPVLVGQQPQLRVHLRPDRPLDDSPLARRHTWDSANAEPTHPAR